MRLVSLACLLALGATAGCDCFDDEFWDGGQNQGARDLAGSGPRDLSFPPGSDLTGIVFDLTARPVDLAPRTFDFAPYDSGVPSRSCGSVCQPNCYEVCSGADTCTHFCPTGCPDCNFDCSSAGACNATCDVNSVCTTNSRGTGKTTTICKSGSACELNCSMLGDCIMNCTSTSACLLRCSNTASCNMTGCSPLTCANGVIVCNRPCP